MRSIRTCLLATMLILGGTGCGEGEAPLPTHTLYGKITSTSVDASGRVAWILLFSSGDQGDGALYSGSCQLSGPGCDYRILFIDEGQYAVEAFIDRNDNAAPGSLEPDSGDLAARTRPLILWDKTEMNFDDNLWEAVP